jgi:hypothetical protein
MFKSEPEHHALYREAWNEYTEFYTTKERRRELEREMDRIQNTFSHDEFKEFRKTLVGYEEYWNLTMRSMFQVIQTWIKRKKLDE